MDFGDFDSATAIRCGFCAWMIWWMFSPFDTASNWTATVALEKGAPTTYPVPYVRWCRSADCTGKTADSVQPPVIMRRLEAVPVNSRRLQSPWLVRPEGFKVDLASIMGPSDYTGHLGANTGGANGVYWLNVLSREGEVVEVENLAGRGKRALPTVRTFLEPDLLYPLARWSDVSRYGATPSTHLLLVQDPATRRGISELEIQRAYPRTYAYLKRFESVLRLRAAYQRYQESAPFYSMYNVGQYTVASHKVVWRRMDRCVRAAVLEPLETRLLGERSVVCQETCAMIAAASGDEAHYLAALLNSSLLGFLVQSHNVRGGKGFGSPGMLEYLNIRRFEPENADHQELAGLSREAHQTRLGGGELRSIEQAIDAKTALVYQMSPGDVQLVSEVVERER